MSVINAMNNASHYTEFPRRTSVNPKLFVEGSVVVKLHLYELINSKRHRGFATITIRSNSSAVAERTTEINS